MVPLGIANHVPTQDDAGSGGDAADVDALATPLPTGPSAGQLAGNVDREDWYTFTPPSGTVMHLAFTRETPWMGLELIAPDGSLVNSGGPFAANGEFVHVAEPAGAWLVHLTYTFVDSLDLALDYSLALSFTTPDHVSSVGPLSGDAPAVAVYVPPDQYRAVDVRTSLGADDASESHSWVTILQVCADQGFAYSFTAILRAGSVGEARVWTQTEELGSSDLDVALPYEFANFGSGPTAFETTEGGFTVYDASATDVPVSIQGWVAWNDPGVAPTMTDVSGTARFEDLQGFSGQGPAVQVGPYAVADDLSLTHQAQGGQEVILVEALTPQYATDQTRMTVTPPDGIPVHFEGDTAVWWAFQSQAGAWHVALEHLDGLEGDLHRFVTAAWPFPTAAECFVPA